MNKKKAILVIMIAAALIALAAMVLVSKRCSQPQSAVPEGKTLVWSDEFDYNGAPNPEFWGYSMGNTNGWGNAEIQKYTDKRENSLVHDGVLTITAQRIPKSNMWTSARLKTQYKAKWTYGYIEISARLPSGVGTWPALWMLPDFDKYGGWPRSGEIDIMEMVGFEPDVIHTTAHSNAFNHKKNTQKTHFAKIPRASKRFHTYAIDWTEDYIRWIIDGDLFYEVTNPHMTTEEWPFDIPFYLIMNIAIGGTWGGQKGIDDALQSASMDIDYVRVYQ